MGPVSRCPPVSPAPPAPGATQHPGDVHCSPWHCLWGRPGGSVPASPLPRGRGLWPRPGGRGQPLPRAQPCPHIPPCWGHERSDLVPVPKPGDRWIHRLGAGGGFGPCGHRGVAQAAGAASPWRGRARAGEGGRVPAAGCQRPGDSPVPQGPTCRCVRAAGRASTTGSTCRR